MSEINEIFKMFKKGGPDSEWKKFLNSIRVSSIHGWAGQEMRFRFPIVAIVGENGIGKSTFLKAAACAYVNTSGASFFPSTVFMNTKWDKNAMEGALIEYEIRVGDKTTNLRAKRNAKRWRYSLEKGKRPKRAVFFLDISRTLPLDETAGYAKIAKLATKEVGKQTVLDDSSCAGMSEVLGQHYESARFVGTDVDSKKEIGLLQKSYGEISQFHQGAGESEILDLFKLLQSIPNQSLLIIDEIENSLHPQAQRRLTQFLIKLSRKKKLQIILSTHSPFVLKELPQIARIMLIELGDEKGILEGVSTEYALTLLEGDEHPELNVYLEDKAADAFFWELINRGSNAGEDLNRKITTRAVGGWSVVNTINCFYLERRLPGRGLGVVDGDKRGDAPKCAALPGEEAPEKQVVLDLQKMHWGNLAERFGTDPRTLHGYLDEAILLEDHHDWMNYIGERVKKPADVVWNILLEEWCDKCLSEESLKSFVDRVRKALQVE